MENTLKAISPIIIAIAVILALVFILAPEPIVYDYSFGVEVDKSEKIETAISNVVNDICRRDFVVTGLEVKWHPAKRYWRVYGTGTSRADILKKD